MNTDTSKLDYVNEICEVRNIPSPVLTADGYYAITINDSMFAFENIDRMFQSIAFYDFAAPL